MEMSDLQRYPEKLSPTYALDIHVLFLLPVYFQWRFFSANVNCAEEIMEIFTEIFLSQKTTLSFRSRGTVGNWILSSMHGIGAMLTHEISLSGPSSSRKLKKCIL